MALSTIELLALAFGVLGALRIFAVLFPAQARMAMKKQAGAMSDGTMRLTGIALIVIGLACAWLVLQSLSVAQVAATLLAFSLLAGGVLLFIPRLARAFWREDIESSDTAMRLLAALTAIIGIAVIYAVLNGW